jgi:hypothetical protein
MRRSLRWLATFVLILSAAVVVWASASYPSATKSFSTHLAGQVIASADINAIQDEIVAIENGLRTGLAHNVLPDANNTRDLGASGTKWANVYTTALNVNGATIQAPVIQTTTSTGTVNDFALTTGANVLRCNNATALTLTGFTAGTDGQSLIVVSIGAGQVNLSHQTGSTAANQLINFATSGVTPLAAGVGWAQYVYDATTARWRLVSHEQGAWITPTYASGNYTAATGTWTVDSGDVTTQAYWLKGRTLTVAFNLVTTSVSATPVTLNIGNGAWGSFTSAKAVIGTHVNADNAAAFAVGYVAAGAGGSILTVNKITGSWATATNTTAANGQITFEVQ